jgi:hypothetical protein
MKENKENLIEKNNEICLPKIINTEVNLLIFPFFILERKSQKLETEYKDIIKRGNKKIEITWNVSANTKYGYPGLFDREVHKVIEQIISEILKIEGKIENPISFSIYDLCNRIGITSSGGKNYRKVKESLERIRMTGIKSEGAFYHKGQKEWITKAFGLYDSIVFRGERLEDGTVSEKNLLFLGNIYLQSLNCFNIKSIDYTYWRSLKNNIASRLYEILGIKFYGIRNKKEGFIRYKYSTLCQLLPVKIQRYFSSAKRQLNESNNELKNTGFISKFEWSENGKNDWLIYYWPGERAKKEMKNGQAKQLEFKEDDYLIDSDNNSADITIKKQPESDHDNDLINQLTDLNVSKITAKNLVKKYNNILIKDWVRAIDFTNAENKAAYIVKAVKEDWQLPEEYLREKEENTAQEEQQKINSFQKKEQEKKQKILQEEKQKLDHIYHSLAPEKQKEIDLEAENRLDDFWKSQLNKERSKGKISKILQIALDEKRREFIKNQINIDL